MKVSTTGDKNVKVRIHKKYSGLILMLSLLPLFLPSLLIILLPLVLLPLQIPNEVNVTVKAYQKKCISKRREVIIILAIL